MAKSTTLSFRGGSVSPGHGETTSAQVHTVFLHEITITDAGQESHIYALFDKNKPTASAPFFEPVSTFDLAGWCIRGDVVQVDLSEVMDSDTDRYSGLLQDVILETDQTYGMYVHDCTLRTMVKQGTTGVRFAWFALYLIMDQDTSVTYLATPVHDNPEMMDIPDHKVQVDSTDNPNYLAYKIMGDGSTVSVDVVRENALGQPIDPFLRISASKNTDVIRWSEVLASETKSAFETRIQADITAGIEPVVIDDVDAVKRIATLSGRNTYIDGQQVERFSVFRTAANESTFTNYIPGKGITELRYLNLHLKNNVAAYDPDDGLVTAPNNRNLTYTYTGSNTLNFVVSPIDGMAANFAVKITSTAATDGTVTVYKKANGLYIPLKPSVAGGTTVEAGKTYQLTCVGDCWTIAEFEEPSVGLKTKIGNKFYRVVKIGSLYWMAENLAYNATAETGDLNSTSIWYDNDSSTYGDYGKHYCFTDAAREEILAAAPGWRFPTQAEMAALFTESVADLKAATGWTNAGTDGTGFSGVPGGKYSEEAFSLYGTQGQWWCVPNDDPLTAVNQCYLTDGSKGTALADVTSYASIRLVKEA